jgi:signal transduction histidine kinase
VIGRAKAWLKRHWPALRLRTILFGTLLFTAALPGFGALFLRVYENTLVRQTETELIAQGAALVATGQAVWPGAVPVAVKPDYRPEASTIDLRSTAVLDERPHATVRGQLDPDAMRVAALLAPIVATTENTTLASIQLLDRHGTVVLGHEASGSYAALPEVAAALKGKVGTVLRTNGAYSQVYSFEWLSRASSLRIHHVRPIVVNGQVVGVILLSRSPRALFRGLYEDRGKILLGIALIFGMLLVMTGLLSRGIARPIEALGKATRDVAAGTGTVPETPATAAIEIRGLYENFRAMAAAIDRRSRYLRDFAASVSHEFKTPLAGISGAIELLEDHGSTMKPAERERFLGNIKADASRLSQLVTRLLDLARADMAQPDPDPDPAADALAAIRHVADAFDGPELSVGIDAPDTLPRVGTPQSTIEAVLNTLLENARQAGAAKVAIGLLATGDQLRIEIADNGPGIAPGDAERVFEPFFTTRRPDGGTGLGLAISLSLLRAGGGELKLESNAAPGARFVLTLPIAGG